MSNQNIEITPNDTVKLVIERKFNSPEEMLESINDLRELQKLMAKPEAECQPEE